VLLPGRAFSALDYLTRLRMRNELARLLSEMPRTAGIGHSRHRGGAASLRIGSSYLRNALPAIRRQFRISTRRPRELTNPEVVDAMGRILDALDIEDAAGQN